MIKEHEALKNKSNAFEKSGNDSKQQLIATEKELAQTKHLHGHWQSACEQAQEELNLVKEKLINFEKQIAMLAHENSDKNNQLIEFKNQNKSLAHDKWILSQEKAQLLGQFKQIELTAR